MRGGGGGIGPAVGNLPLSYISFINYAVRKVGGVFNVISSI